MLITIVKVIWLIAVCFVAGVSVTCAVVTISNRRHKQQLKDTTWGVYQKTIAQAGKVYKEATAPARETYKEAIAPLREIYNKAMVVAWEVYEKANEK